MIRCAGTPTVLAERDSEVAQLHHRVDALREHGRSAVVTITGNLGVGLSAVLDVAVARASGAGLRVCLARCSPAESDLGYGVVSQLAAGLGGPLRALIGEPHRSLTPALCAGFLAFARIHPLVVAVDDLQWADQRSLEWLRAMARRVHQAPMLLVLATAMAEPPEGGDRWFTDPRQETARMLRLRPLRARGVRRVISSSYAGWAVDESFVAGATEASGGSPAVLRAVLHHFTQEALPPTAEHVPEFAALAAEVIDARAAAAVAALPGDALTLLRAIAIAGEGLGFVIAAALAGPRAVDALAMLVRLGLVVDADAPKVANQAVATHALAGMSVTEHTDLARRAAELGHRTAVSDDALAELLLATPPPHGDWAADLLCRVALRRRADGAHDAAATLLSRALREPVAEPDRHRLRVELGMAEVAYRPQASDRRLHRVLMDSGAGAPLPVLLAAADLLHSRGDARTAHRAIATACERANGDTTALAAIGWLAENESAGAPVLPVPAVPALPERPVGPVPTAVVAWRLTLDGRDRTRAGELARDALRAEMPWGPRIYACRVLKYEGELSEAILGLDRVLADARRHGARVPSALALAHRADCELRRGNTEQSTADLHAAENQLPLDAWHPSALPAVVAIRTAVLLARRDTDAAARLLAEDLPTGADEGPAWAHLLFQRGRLALRLGDPAAAARHLRECGRVLLRRRWSNPALLPWREQAAKAHLALGEHSVALCLAQEAVARAEAWGAPEPLRVARRLLSALTGTGC